MSARRLFVASAACLCSITFVGAQSAPRASRFTTLALSPDGTRLAWIGPPSRVRSISRSRIVITDPTATAPTTVVALPNADRASASEIAWSSDSRQLAILATTGRGKPALYLASARGGAARHVATIPGSVHALQFSPDRSSLAFLYTSPTEQVFKPTDVTPRDTGAMDTHIDRQHLAVLNLTSARLRVLSPADLYIYEFDWSPDGKRFVVSAANGSGNNNWWVARLSTIESATGAIREIARPSHQIAVPKWSPDGARIAYIGGLMSDQGVTGGDLYVVPASGGYSRNVIPRANVSIASFSWLSPSSILATSWAQGGSQIASVDIGTGVSTPLWYGEEFVSLGKSTENPTISASRDGRMVALVRESLNSPPEIWAGLPGRLMQLTRVNAAVRPDWGRGVTVRWRSDAYNVQGFVIYPQQFDPRRRYPMVVHIHGGPSSAYRNWFLGESSTTDLIALSQAGYFVFLPNPRGSYGQGEAFTTANVKDFGRGDLRDVLAGVDVVTRVFPVDGRRLGIKGWSYGGFMTMWTVTQTNRFRAAVAGAGIANWLSYTGQNGISEWMVPFFGATAYEDPVVYAKSSPINYIDRARTPTLIVVGERDAECPSPQSFEFWRGLQHVNVPTQLVVYPDEGHAFAREAHKKDLTRRTVAWFDRWLR